MFKLLACSGYMAPEYAMHGQFSVKSDVFSFGVLILEIVSGLTNSGISHGENTEELLSYVSLPFLTIASLLHLYCITIVFLNINVEWDQ